MCVSVCCVFRCMWLCVPLTVCTYFGVRWKKSGRQVYAIANERAKQHIYMYVRTCIQMYDVHTAYVVKSVLFVCLRFLSVLLSAVAEISERQTRHAYIFIFFTCIHTYIDMYLCMHVCIGKQVESRRRRLFLIFLFFRLRC